MSLPAAGPRIPIQHCAPSGCYRNHSEVAKVLHGNAGKEATELRLMFTFSEAGFRWLYYFLINLFMPSLS